MPSTLTRQRTAERLLRTLSRDIYGIQRRVGIGIDSDLFAEKKHTHFAAGLGPWAYDYLIDPRYDGLDGETFNTVHGFTYKAYRTLNAAVDNADANRNDPNQHTTFYLIDGIHPVTAKIDPVPAQNESTYRFIGSGPFNSVLEATIDGMTILGHTGLIGSNPRIEIYNLGFGRQSGVSDHICVDMPGGYTLRISNCAFTLNGSNSVGVKTGFEQTGLHIMDSYFELGGKGIQSEGPGSSSNIIEGNMFFNLNQGVEIELGGTSKITRNVFYSCDEAIKFVGGSIPTEVLVAHNLMHASTGEAVIEFAGGTFATAVINIIGNVLDNTNPYGIRFKDVSGGGQNVIYGVVIAYNVFGGQESSSGGVHVATATEVQNSLCYGNIFEDFTSGKEIVNWDGPGNEAFHNISTDDIGTSGPPFIHRIKYPLADIGSPVGHGGTGSGMSMDAAGNLVSSPTKMAAFA